MRHRLPFSLLLLACAACAGGGDEPAQQTAALGIAGAHEHGVARVSVAVDDTVVTIEMIAPGMSLYGFEGAAATAAQRAARDGAVARLRDSFPAMFEFAAESGCVVAAPTVNAGAAAHGEAHSEARDEAHDEAHDDDHGHAHDGDGRDPAAVRDTARAHEHADGDGHDEVLVVARASCARSPVGTRLRIAVGRLFPDVEHVDLQVVSDTVQFGARVAASGYVVGL